MAGLRRYPAEHHSQILTAYAILLGNPCPLTLLLLLLLYIYIYIYIYMHLCDCFFILIHQSHTIHSNTTFQFQKEADMEALTLTGLLKQKEAEFPSGRALSASGKFDLTHSQLDELVDKATSLLIEGIIQRKPGIA